MISCNFWSISALQRQNKQMATSVSVLYTMNHNTTVTNSFPSPTYWKCHIFIVEHLLLDCAGWPLRSTVSCSAFRVHVGVRVDITRPVFSNHCAAGEGQVCLEKASNFTSFVSQQNKIIQFHCQRLRKQWVHFPPRISALPASKQA